MDKVITVAATVVIAFMAIVNATVSIYQWQELQRANKINAQNTYEIQRPFIYASRMELSPVIVGSSLSYDLDPVIFNGGNSAPKTLAAYINYYSTSDPINPDYTFPDLVDVITATAAGAPKDYVRTVAKNYTAVEMQQFADRKRFLYIYGHIEYDDTFSGSPHHSTDFCFELAGIRGTPDLQSLLPPTNPSTSPAGSQPTNGTPPPINLIPFGQPNAKVTGMLAFNFPACRKHNCTDTACKG